MTQCAGLEQFCMHTIANVCYGMHVIALCIVCFIWWWGPQISSVASSRPVGAGGTRGSPDFGTFGWFVFNWGGMNPRTQPVWTLFLFKFIWTRSQGSQGCQKIRFYFLQVKMLSFCAKIALERHKLRKIIKWKKMSKNTCFPRLFQIYFNLGAILAHQTSNGMFSGSWSIFWHLWDPWRRIHIGDIKVLEFVFWYFCMVAPPTTFFKQFKIKSELTFIAFRL